MSVTPAAGRMWPENRPKRHGKGGGGRLKRRRRTMFYV